MKINIKTPVGRISKWLPVALVILVYVIMSFSVREVADDTYIFLRYAKNFTEGKGLVFNPGERVEGFSGFMWLLLVSLPVKLGFDPLSSARMLGLIAGAGTLVFISMLSMRVLNEDVPALFHAVPAALLVSYRYFVYWSVQGMEAPLFTFFVMGAVYYYVSECMGGGRRAAPVFLALASMTRPEGIMIFALTAAHRLVFIRREERWARKAAMWSLPYAAIVVPFILWKYSYYGYFLPNTYYAKSEFDGVQTLHGWKYLMESFGSLGFAWPLVAIVPAAILMTRKMPIWFYYLVLLTAVSLMYIVAIGGDILPFCRFFMHFAPIVVALFFLSASWLFTRTKGGRLPVAAAVLVFAVLSLSLFMSTAAYTRDINPSRTWADVGTWLRDNTPPDTVIAVTSAGATPYFSERYAIDLLGLNDSYIAHHPIYTAGKTATEKKYNSGYVLSKKPGYIVFRDCDWPRANCELDLYDRQEFRDNYAPLNIYVKTGVYTIYKRVECVKDGRAGGGYIPGLGRKYGYAARKEFDGHDPAYLVTASYLGRLNPHHVNHYKDALFYFGREDYASAGRELEVEIRDNPDFAPAYILLALVCRHSGDSNGMDEASREFEMHNPLHIPVSEVNINFCF